MEYFLKMPTKVFGVYYYAMSFIGLMCLIFTVKPEFILVTGFNIISAVEVKKQGENLDRITHLIICSLLGLLFTISAIM